MTYFNEYICALNMPNSITFLYPSKNIGGAQLLFARLAKHISTKTQTKVQVVDYPDGFLKDYLKDTQQVEIIDYAPGVLLPKDSVTITPLSHIADLRFMIAEECLCERILFWSIHPDNIKYVLHSNYRNIFRLGAKKLKFKLAQMARDGIIVFMDGSTKFSFEKELDEKIEDPVFFPIPIEFDEAACRSVRLGGRTVSIAWLGRFSYDKINSIIKLIDDIAESSFKNNIKLYLIGDGDELDKAIGAAKKRGLNFIHTGVVQGKKLNDYLLNNIDIGVTMGTSCLEVCKLYIPAAIVDYSLTKIPKSHGYDWFCETKDYSLGNEVAWGKSRRMSFDDMIMEFMSDNENVIGNKCYATARQYHSIESTSKRILAGVESFGDAERWRVIKDVDALINSRVYDLIYRLGKRLKNMTQ